jgi:phosphatidylglycerol:prolipoprotein diacylglycerol transferase
MSWFGGFVGGAIAAMAATRLRGRSVVPLLAVAAPATALGQAIGRLGCFLVGDDYGRPTDLPWGVAFPRGLPPTTARVHPTQIYEALFLALLTWALVWWRRRGVDDRSLLTRYLLVAGAGRFAIETIRVNAVVALGLTLAQWVSLAMVALGLFLILAARTARPAPAPGIGS